LKERLENIRNTIVNLPILKEILDWSKRYSLPGFAGVPIYNIINFIYKEMTQDNITTRANSVAFSLFIAIFPFIIFLFTLLPILFQPSDFAYFLQKILPDSSTISESATYLEILKDGLLSVGFFLAIFFASSGMLTLMSGFDKSYEETFKTRGYFRKRGVAIMLTILLSTFFIVSFFFLIIGNLILGYLSERWGISDSYMWVIKIIKYLIAFLLIYLGITIIYRYGSSLKRRVPLINPGSILATILSILTSVGFSYFVNNFGRYNELYGSIGALIVIMLWLQFNAFVILIGYELNASIAVNRDVFSARKVEG